MIQKNHNWTDYPQAPFRQYVVTIDVKRGYIVSFRRIDTIDLIYHMQHSCQNWASNLNRQEYFSVSCGQKIKHFSLVIALEFSHICRD